MLNNTFFPLNLIFAKAYPASSAMIPVIKTAATVRIKLFINHCPNGFPRKASTKFCTVNVCGRPAILLTYSSCVLNEFAVIKYNGKIITTTSKIINSWETIPPLFRFILSLLFSHNNLMYYNQYCRNSKKYYADRHCNIEITTAKRFLINQIFQHKRLISRAACRHDINEIKHPTQHFNKSDDHIKFNNRFCLRHGNVHKFLKPCSSVYISRFIQCFIY